MNQRYADSLLIYDLMKRFNVSANVKRIFINFLKLGDLAHKSIEISCESNQKLKQKYFRGSILHLNKKELLKITPDHKLQKFNFDQLTFPNSNDRCFGIGVSEYPNQKQRNRLKIYNFYSLSRKKIDTYKHVQMLCVKCDIDYALVFKDRDLLKDIRYSCVDLYSRTSPALKLYSQFLPTEELFKKYKNILPLKAREKYKELFSQGLIPKNCLFCIKYCGTKRSLRIDFEYLTRHSLSRFITIDTTGSAKHLYKTLLNIRPEIKLTAIATDFRRTFKTQFYFQYLFK